MASTGIALLDATTMHEAATLAYENARPGDAVLMSPACASFDMFDNYPHRAAVFREAVAEIADTASHETAASP